MQWDAEYILVDMTKMQYIQPVMYNSVTILLHSAAIKWGGRGEKGISSISSHFII